MHSSNKKRPEQNSHNSAVSYPFWWNSTSSDMPQSSSTHNLNLNLDTHPQKHHQVKQLGCHYEDQDSPSTQSTSQSHHNSGSSEKGRVETNVEHVDTSRRIFSGVNGDFVYHAAQANTNQSVVHIPYYGDPFYGSMVAAYGPQIQTQLYGITPNRVPLPDLAEAEPIYVNAKQYRGIMRRRELRAKLEAQNKLVKARKPYLHESRHRHAMNRARGSGGRFLNTKKCQDSEAASDVEGGSGKNKSTDRPGHGLTNSEVLKRDHTNNTTPSTFSSSNAGISNGQSDMVFSAFHSHMVENLQDGGNILRNGAQPRVPVIR